MIKGLTSLSTFITPKVNSGIHRAIKPFGLLKSRFGQQGPCVNCLGSGGPGGLCNGCLKDLPGNLHFCCQCALPLRSFSARPAIRYHCAECLQDPPPFRQIIAPLEYRYPVDAMIQRYKYGHQRAYAKPLMHLLSEHLTQHLSITPADRPDLLLPCPMHKSRRRRKGTNQAADIAEHLSRELGIPWSTELLVRPQKTRPQQGLPRKERLNNLNDAFLVKRVPPSRVAVIDDVVTTGSTARVLARRLIEAGASDVQVWALARTPA